MERRDRSIKALEELKRIDSLESYEKADALVLWYEEHIGQNSVEDFDLELEDLKQMEELFFKSINFLKNQKTQARDDLSETRKMKKFLNN
ncbi:hypothetical protein [Arcobacter roscoffensis]|uniref:Uncharacterized protein n=1 Tax=Arcobacter roscoffensis TaxID=2961520 RepID=A0ABY5E240_9BACT|nr:hypothetical protein [Arcobacter roscoffensis]UTJ06256.1 hypothetical protein NJU99_13525 [Arcobacter roscoffensis]